MVSGAAAAEGFSDPRPYDWAFTTRGEHRLDILREARENIESLPATKTTFRVAQVADVGTVHDRIANLLRFLGCWMVPDRHVGGKPTSELWVNPRAKWAPKYSDAAVVCECGALRLSPEFRTDSHSHYVENEEYAEACTDDCPADARFRAKARIWEARRRVLEQAAQFALPTMNVARRFDVAPDNVRVIAQNLGYPGWTEIQAHGYRRRRATWQRLSNDYDILHKDIADAFGCSRQTVSDHIRGRQDYYHD